MPEEPVKRRRDKCKLKTLNFLLENYNVIYTAKEPFNFLCHDKLGLRYIRVEVDSFEDTTKELIQEFKKECPPNTIFEIRLFEKHTKKPRRWIL